MNLYRLVRRLRFFFIEVIVPHQSDPFMSCREQLSLDKGVESSIEAAPAAAEITPFEDVGDPERLGQERAPGHRPW